MKNHSCGDKIGLQGDGHQRLHGVDKIGLGDKNAVDDLLVVGRLPALFGDRVDLMRNLFGARNEGLAGRRQGDALVGAQEQGKAQLLLQGVDLLFYGLPGEKEQLLRLAEAAALRRGQ